MLDNEELNNEQVQEEQQEQPVEQVQEDTPQSEQPEFVLDENGNLQWNTNEYDHLDDEDSDGEPTPQEQPQQEEEQTQEEQPQEEPKYKVKVGNEEVEVTQEELVRGYMRQSDYTRKTQELANQRHQFEQLYRQPIQQQPIQLQTNQPQESLNDVAKRLAAHQLGLNSPEDLSELDFDHIAAVVEARQALINQRNAMMTRQQNINNLEMQLRSEEPKYDDIMANINEAMQNLPVSKFNQLKQAYNNGNTEPLREFFKEMQKDYYANVIQKVEQKKSKPVPKVVPTSNTPIEQPKQNKKIDFRKLGNMSMDQKAKLLLDMGFVD